MNKKNYLKTSGYTLLEILIAMGLLIFVIVGFMIAVSQFELFLKNSKINNRAKELAQQISREITSSSYEELKNCIPPSTNGTLATQNGSMYVSFDTPSFYTKDCNLSPDCALDLSCEYCYREGKILSGYCDSGGYPIYVGYNSGIVQYFNNATGVMEEIGLGIGINVYYVEPKGEKEREIHLFIYKKNIF